SRQGTPAMTKWAACQVAASSPNIGKLGCDFAQDPYSYHPGGSHFAFLDGSSKWLAETIDLRLFAALLSRKGGEIINNHY
ncbi:MAG TPA: H-X9-DG-CTERM domain-containing protein, partial [Pirellulales bacterium]